MWRQRRPYDSGPDGEHDVSNTIHTSKNEAEPANVRSKKGKGLFLQVQEQDPILGSVPGMKLEEEAADFEGLWDVGRRQFSNPPARTYVLKKLSPHRFQWFWTVEEQWVVLHFVYKRLHL